MRPTTSSSPCWSRWASTNGWPSSQEGWRPRSANAANACPGGERQRLGVARALLADRPILLLDEPTAHLDEERAATVRQAVRQADRATTAVVWITHRLADVDDFDEVVVLEHGRVVDRGRADDLRRAAGPSARLWADAAR